MSKRPLRVAVLGDTDVIAGWAAADAPISTNSIPQAGILGELVAIPLRRKETNPQWLQDNSSPAHRFL